MVEHGDRCEPVSGAAEEFKYELGLQKINENLLDVSAAGHHLELLTAEERFEQAAEAECSRLICRLQVAGKHLELLAAEDRLEQAAEAESA